MCSEPDAGMPPTYPAVKTPNGRWTWIPLLSPVPPAADQLSSKESHRLGLKDLKIDSLESRKKSTPVTRQQKKSRDFFQNYCISVTSISVDWKLHVKLIICQTSGAAMCMIFSILQSCVSGSRIFSLPDPVAEFSKLYSNPMTLWIISCSKTHVQFYYFVFFGDGILCLLTKFGIQF